jgi:hypothetical protein
MNLMFIKNEGRERKLYTSGVSRRASRRAHKRWKGNVPQVDSPGNIWIKDLGWYLAKVSLGHERGFKILPVNDTKMLLHKL